MNCYSRITIDIYTGIDWGTVCFQVIAVKSTEDVTSQSGVVPYNSVIWFEK